MDALSDVRLRDRAALVGDVLVVADLHVGKGVSSNLELPVGDGADMVTRIEALCERFEPDEVILAGDILHSFTSIPRLAEETIEGIRDVTQAVGADIVLIPGNHDTMLDVVWSGQTTPEYRIGETVVCHGHVEPVEGADRYVVAHDHPTITIEGQRRPCYLAGDGVYEGADLLVLPAFNRLLQGVSINEMSTSDFMSPLVCDVDALSPIVHDDTADETLVFPPLGEFRHQLRD